MNWLDKTISWVAPETGVRRASARAQLGVYGSYEGGRRGRRHDNWSVKSNSANEDIKFDLEALRDRSRWLVRNTPYGERGISARATGIIGKGIVPKFTGDNAKQIQALWDEFAKTCDYDSDTSFYGQQALAARTESKSGEALLVFKPVRAPAGKIPLKIQQLEPDYIDHMKNVSEIKDGVNAGGSIVQGIELSPEGQRVAYWLFDRHPGDNRSTTSRRISVRYIVHVFEKQRPGQLRGVPSLTPVITKIRDLDDYDSAELFAKKLQACFANFITQNGDGQALGKVDYDPNSTSRKEKMQPGMNVYLRPGESVTASTPPVAQGYPEYVKKHLRDIAAALGITYEMLTGDLTGVNYSSYRAGHIEYRARMEQLRDFMIIPMLCVPVYERFIELALALGLVDKPPVTVEWVTPRWQSIDPLKDNRADLLAVRSGFETLMQVASERGYDMPTLIEEFKEANKMLDDAGIILDSDPRRVTLSGAVQSTVNTKDDE